MSDEVQENVQNSQRSTAPLAGVDGLINQDGQAADVEIEDDLSFYGEEDSVEWAKKLDLPNIRYEKIIKKNSQKELNIVASYVEQTKESVDQFRIDQEQSLQLRYTQMVQKVKSDITKKYLKQLSDFTNNADLYFDCLEEHCAIIVKKSLEILGKDIEDRDRLLSSVKAASGQIKDEGEITLRINPDQMHEIDSFSLSPSWSVVGDESISKGNCRFNVPLGQHSSEFDTTISALFDLIEK